MKNIRFYSTKSANETIKFGQSLSKFLKKGDIVCLYGDLGSGKTTLVKGIAKGLGVSVSKVHSPTFVLMNLYEGNLPLFHFDLYRIDGEEGMETVGYDEFFYGEGISVVEWAERLGKFSPQDFLKIELKHAGDDKRKLLVSSNGLKYKDLVDRFKGVSL